MLLVRFTILVVALCSARIAGAQSYWQQEVNYSIDVSLNDKQHSLEGFERMEYINHSPDTLRFIWIHLWPNAYKNDRTAFTDQQLQNGNTAFYFSGSDDKGYINKLNFKVDNETAETVDHPNYIDIVQLVLPSPLLPGKKIVITTPFHVQLPYNFSRGGHIGESYQATQWYPKPAVYDRQGWHPMPYLDQGEFYSEFGSFEVRVTVPENYVVAATGELQDDAEKNWLRTRSSFDWKPEKIKIKTKAGSYKTTYQQYPSSAVKTKTLTFKESRIHDFAWFADKRFIVDMDTCRLPSGKLVDVASYYLPEEKSQWQHSVAYAKTAVRNRSRWIGEYPYKNVSVVQGPKGYGAGMEYPTITLIPPAESEIALDKVIEHEIGHNWFYGILGSNERQYPWMDEGLNSYYENRHSQLKYPAGDAKFGNTSYHSKDMATLFVNTVVALKKDQPINTPSDSLSEINYALMAYLKTADWLSYLEAKYGRDKLDNAIQAYYEQWKFRHPQPADLKESISKSLGVPQDSLFSYLDKTGPLPNSIPGGTRVVFTSPRSIANYISSPVKNLISIGPAIGTNKYDNIALGLFFTNYKFPPSPLQFFVAPMYSTGIKKLAGTGLVNYSFHPDNGAFRKIRIGVSASAFGINEFKDSGKTTSLSFHKIVPSVRFVLTEKNPKSTMNRYIQFKTFMISEDALQFYNDTTIVGTDTSVASKYRVINNNRTLNQLMLVWENNRALYPYRGELKIEQGTDFVRAGFTGNYFFNYAKGGGLDLRLFAGKFFYTSSKTFSKQIQTDRYHLNMTGANGREDYTYSDYFAGRNAFEGTASQQIMVRDGAFKVRTDLLADKIGKTDNWLAAINLSSSIPSSINPLSLLPIKIPLKFFLDIGTYADAWKRNSNEDRFLYDAGLQIPLLNETVNIYIPLLYSSVYKDYINSTIADKKFWKKISFSIDISHFSLRKINRNLALE
ncbi:M1 family metallopeptidase [Terrimonas sp. NA20]|uniref:M1 family metallopeptidase n=1 Tax=Terrimonas ginsenosidimutans TaxID=2908004 RepID=A0ABS9KTX5_9BACT|nr:M1 family metallopeptidase [Terrimonas ginsenosidimutans]MCG2615792.1 M1 family metallopeptidase [Terrimonas ginsenosidimutans]